MLSSSTKSALDLLQSLSFRNKSAETSCESLGLKKDLIRNAYKEVEGLVGYITTFREIATTRTTIESQTKSDQEKTVGRHQKLLNYYSSLIFNHSRQTEMFLDASSSSSSSSSYLETITKSWPEKWFRSIGERKCQLQIPLSSLRSPTATFSESNNNDENNSVTEANENMNRSSSDSSSVNLSSSSCITLPPHLQQLALVFEQIVTSYLEDLLVKKNLIPSAFDKGLFVKGSSSGDQKNAVKNSDNDGRHQLLAKMKSKSVLRLWIYFGEDDDDDIDEGSENKNEDFLTKQGTGKTKTSSTTCRGHFDPGVVTVLLSGSKRGLQVHKTFVGGGDGASSSDTHRHHQDAEKSSNTNSSSGSPPPPSSYEYATHDALGKAQDKDWIDVGFAAADADDGNEAAVIDPSAKKPCYSDTNIVLMNDTLLQVLTGGVAQHCFHRVVVEDEDDHRNKTANDDDECDDKGHDEDCDTRRRIQIVLELRPDNASKWYGFTPTDAEKQNLAQAMMMI